ncbi:hypothetical protein V8B97DRAFT_2020578 [Scleroderma yunnanense]
MTKCTSLPESHKSKGKGGISVQDQPTLQEKKFNHQVTLKRTQTYGDPGFKDAFKHKPNQCSDKVLALYLSWRDFQEHCCQSTIDGIQAAFKMWWDEKWCFHSAEVENVVASIWHKISSDGIQQTHSGAMKKEYMDCILTWSHSLCPLDIPFKFVGLAMAGLESPLPRETLSNKMRLLIIQHTEQLVFNAVTFTLWTRNFKLVKLKCRDVQFDNIAIDGMFLKYMQGKEHSLTLNDLNTYFEIHLRNQKGWQRKLDKGIREIHRLMQCHHLTGNQYKIYPHPDMGMACDTFWWLLLWVKWVKYVHLGHSMAKEDFLFPAVGTNGVLQPGIPFSHDTVQRWIDEAIVGAGISGRFSTHCFHQGDGKQQDTLMHYLLNKLYCYENNHSNALGPISQEADHLLAGEGMLIWPAFTEALCLAHASLTADVAALHASMNKMSESQAMMSEDIRDLCQKLGNMTTAHQHPTSVQTSTIQLPLTIKFTPNAQSPLPTLHSWQMWFSTLLVTITMAGLAPMLHLNATVSPPVLHSNVTISVPPPSLIGPQRTVYSSIPPKGMLIPNVPVIHKDNMQTPRTESWKDIIHHWTKGEEFHENKKDFLKAYGSTAHLGHMSLLKAILAAHKEYPRNGECCHHLINETQGDSSPPSSVV